MSLDIRTIFVQTGPPLKTTLIILNMTSNIDNNNIDNNTSEHCVIMQLNITIFQYSLKIRIVI